MKKLLNFRPAFFIVVGIIVSLYSSFLIFKGDELLGVIISLIFFVSVLTFCIVYGKSKTTRNLIFFFVLCLVCLVTAFSFLSKLNDYESASLDNGYYYVEGRIKDVTYSQNYTFIIVDDAKVEGLKEGRLKYKIRMYVGGYTYADVGDVVEFYAKITDVGLTYDGRYSWSNVASGVKYFCTVSREDLAIIANDRTLFEDFNVFIRDTLRSGMDDDSFAVAYAMLCGNSDYTDTDVFDGYRSAGVAHIFAVSGLHIGFLSSALYIIFKKVRINEYVKTLLIITVLFAYSGVCGFSSSSLRATVMFGVLSFARVSGKRYDMLSSISLAFIILALFDSLQVFTAGFILSFCVVYGIAVLSNPLTRLLKFLPRKISSNLATVLSAQIYFIPLSVAIFGEFSLLAILVNFVFIPPVSIIYVVTFLSTLIGGIFSIQKVTLYLPNLIFKLLNYLVNAFDYEAFMIGGFIFGGLAVVYYLITFVFSGAFNLKRVGKAVAMISLSVVFLGGTVGLNAYESNKTKIYVIGETDVCVTAIVGSENVMVVSFAKEDFSLKRLTTFSNKTGVDTIDRLIIADAYSEIEVQSLITKLRKIFDVNAVCYPKKDDVYDLMLKRSFVDSEIISFSTKNQEEILFDGIYSRCNGKAIEIIKNERKIVIFSEFGDYIERYKDFYLPNVDLMVAYDCIDGIDEVYNPKVTISYLSYKNCQNGNVNGYYVREIK